MARLLLLLGCLLLIQAKTAAQTAHLDSARMAKGDPIRVANGDSARMAKLLADARAIIVDKVPVTRSDLDIARALLDTAAGISRKGHFATALETATLLTSDIHILDSQYALAWNSYNSFNDSSRVEFLDYMMRKREPAIFITGPLYDSARRWRKIELPLLASLHSPRRLPRLYFTIGSLYMDRHDRKEMIDCIHEGWARVHAFGDFDTEAEFLKLMAICALTDSMVVQTVSTCVDQLVADEERLLPTMTGKQQFDAITRLTYIGIAFNYYSRMAAPGMAVLQRALSLNQRLHQHNALALNTLSDTYAGQGKMKEALTFALEAVRVSETPAGAVDGSGYVAAMLVYYAIGDYNKSLEYFNKALAVYKKDPTRVQNPVAVVTYGIKLYLLLGRAPEGLDLLQWIRQKAIYVPANLAYYTGSLYGYLNKWDSAEYYYQVAANAALGTQARHNAYFGLAGLYISKHQYAKAKPLVDTLTVHPEQSPLSILSQQAVWGWRYVLDSVAKDYPRAVADLRFYYVLKDSLTNITRNGQLAEMEVQYETDKKNQHIADLEKQNLLQTRLQQSTIRQNSIIRNSLIAGAALLAVLAGLLFSRYRTRQRTNRRLEKLLKEKDWLLREIHHRTKNNLQIIVSLLHIQSDQLTDRSAIGAFEEISARVNAISLVHKKLYGETDDMSSISMREYIADLVQYLSDGIGQQRCIAYNLDIDPITLDVVRCVPLGLILNEAITNSIKYAFPAGVAAECPQVNISLHRQSGDHAGKVCLRIADNGIGLPRDFDLHRCRSLGLELIQSLTIQLEGELTITNDPGANLLICFPH